MFPPPLSSRIIALLTLASITTAVSGRELSLIGEISNASLAGAQKILVSSDDKFVYCAGENGHSISWYQRDAAGTLSFLGSVKNDSNGVSGIEWVIDLAMGLDERFLYAVTYDSESLVWFSRNSQTGSLQFMGKLTQGVDPVDGLRDPYRVALSPDGKNLYTVS